ncbi:MAG: protein-glutamate O-methyltransferase CheR, partial [Magnetococcales bacterium]|nr:protein-glutamate O-methyltransferase CheR [Magnetococcales bacterium]
MNSGDLEMLEVDMLFAALHQRYGYDFRHYSRDSACRRVLRRVKCEGLASVSELQNRVLHDESVADDLIRDLSINVTEMFRDPLFYSALRDSVLPVLAHHDHIKIWHAGCATGEEVYSMAILLTEESLYEKCRLYATDFNKTALDKSQNGIFPLAQMRKYSRNYQAAGGKDPFSDYYYSNYDGAVMKKTLKKNMVFAHHNLATDGAFGEMHLVVCRNVLIYFDRKLQEKVFQLFVDS